MMTFTCCITIVVKYGEERLIRGIIGFQAGKVVSDFKSVKC